MDNLPWGWLLAMLEFGFNAQTNNQTKAHQDAQDEDRIKRETTREVTSDRRFIRTTTLSLIQEGEFTEIEDVETGEIAVKEQADQAADRREEILSDEADED